MNATFVITGLQKLGVPIEITDTIEPSSFFTGVWIDRGVLKVNLEMVKAPGDILHEAGHLAVIPPRFRENLRPGSLDSELNSKFMSEFLNRGGLFQWPECPVARAALQCGECEAIAWSYAAALEIGYPTLKVFVYDNVAPKNQPYQIEGKADGATIHSILSTGHYMGINGLCHGKMCEFRKFPHLRVWMQDVV